MPLTKKILLLSYLCIASLSSAMITPGLPQIQAFFSISSASLSWVISIFLIGYVFGQLIYAPIANRFGRLAALRSGLIVNLIGVVICLIATKIFHNYAALLFGRLITALGSATGLVCTFILINELLSPEEAKETMAYAIVSFTIGVGISVTLGGLLTEYASWTDCFWFLLAHGIMMFLLTYRLTETLEEKISINFNTIFSHYVSAFSNTRLLIFSLMAGIVSVYAYGYSATVADFTQLQLHLSPARYGYWNLFNLFGMLASGYLSAACIKKYTVKKTLLIGMVCMIPLLLSQLLLSFSHHVNLPWFFLTSMGLFLVTGLLFPAASYFASNAIHDRASAASAMSFINMGLATLSVMIIGYLPFSPLLSFSLTLIPLFMLVSLAILFVLM